MEVFTNSTGESLRLGETIGRVLAPGEVVCLDGELGTGKTVLARGIARGRGYLGLVPSPTFLIIHPYPSVKFCHVDAFRLGGPYELVEAGIEEYFDGEWVCAVEWAENVMEVLPAHSLMVRLEFGPGGNRRRITVEGGLDWAFRLGGAGNGVNGGRG